MSLQARFTPEHPNHLDEEPQENSRADLQAAEDPFPSNFFAPACSCLGSFAEVIGVIWAVWQVEWLSRTPEESKKEVREGGSGEMTHPQDAVTKWQNWNYHLGLVTSLAVNLSNRTEGIFLTPLRSWTHRPLVDRHLGLPA